MKQTLPTRASNTIRHFIWSLIRGSFLILLLPACAVVTPNPHATESIRIDQQKLAATPQAEQSYWWFVRVKMTWPEDQEPAWYMDVLLARQVFRPVLLEHALDIEMWRFHRRAAHDKAGHQFSFIFYAKQATADAILSKLADNPLLKSLMAAGKVQALRLYDANKKPDPAIEATSDPNWSLEMQRAWPYYAMGVSQLWLSLIDQYVASAPQSGENPPSEKNVDELIEYYRPINDKLAATWENEGGHALLHHLSALFGYGELFVYERRRTRF